MSPKDITSSQVQEWTEDIVTMLSRLAGDRVRAEPARIRLFLAERNLTPEALFYLRIGLKSDRLASMVEAKRKEGSYSETGNKSVLKRRSSGTSTDDFVQGLCWMGSVQHNYRYLLDALEDD